ncbi:outer membrane protein transport protein [Vibrio aestuarianus]|uniref:Outer membrane protein transport protein n=1 Tax=Vibrio aestuarianus TaxID=28171 RepID=A0A9X4IW75_9VIBR|nr:outer membrane protein transport protein [Vibrio aestuarianus]MDE1232266.1 outer membrane protein transport protein [Vibrio aestuarianus]MDE1263348.1 outer membrane protein transport protein [Vibrio aestuarianus]MDE1295242.1 outer membrane protein transport protein [Vibrio aestuarianus]MDE1336765.1 outer membrane protein transport protein [Vibrio aestuarianus]MDE1345884.1 outer membrane protein transport protein [Vibrio aestuarianus]
MNKTRLFKKSLLAVTVALASQQALAAGFQLNAQSATGLGRAFAGDAVIADNASVMARNPAAMALFDKMELSLGFESITTMIDVKDAKYCGTTCQVAPQFSAPKNANYDDAGGTSIAPNIHLVVPVNDKFAWGVNAYTNFGTKTEFSDSYLASEYGGLTDVKSFNFGLAGSYRINEQWSVGAGLDLIYGQGTMKRTASSDVAVIGGKDLVNVDSADVWAVGFNLGTVFELDENNRFGAAYHYSPEMEAEDDDGQKITLPLPDIFEFSGYHKIQDTKFAVHYSVQWIGWGAFDKIEFRNLKNSPLGSSYDKPYEWQDGWHYAIGGTYYLNNDWTVRAGYMYDTSAQDSLTSVSVPDSDRQWFSAGFTYNIDTASDIDFGFTYLLGQDVDVTEGTPNPAGTPQYLSTLTATTHADAILVGLQYSRSF